MKSTLQIMVLLLGITGSLAYAADPKPDTAHFYDMSTQHITGEVQRPAAMVVETRNRAAFGRLLQLKKSFKAAIVATGKERILQ